MRKQYTPEEKVLRAACAKICRQNHWLIGRVKATDFNAADELDCTQNAAQGYVRRFFAALSLFRYGYVPVEMVKWTMKSSKWLIEEIERKYSRFPEVCLAARKAGECFRSAEGIWGVRNPVVMLSSERYCRELEIARDEFLNSLKELNKRLYAMKLNRAKGQRRLTKKERAKMGILTQSDVARDFGVSRQTVNNWENGRVASPYGYHKDMRTSQELRQSYEILVLAAKRYNEIKEQAICETGRFAMTFTAFNEEYLKHNFGGEG